MALSVEELASRAGTSADTVRRLSDLGILAPSSGEGPFDESIVPRVRLALQLESSGVPLDDVGRAIADGSFSLAFADVLFGRPVRMSDVTQRDLWRELSLSTEFLDDVRVALGATGSLDEPLREDEVQLLQALDRFVHQGLDESVAEAVAAPGAESQLLMERVLILLLHRFLESAIAQEAMQIIERGLEEAGIHRPRQEAPQAIAFLDLSGTRG